MKITNDKKKIEKKKRGRKKGKERSDLSFLLL
jgi:hypothetical protein